MIMYSCNKVFANRFKPYNKSIFWYLFAKDNFFAKVHNIGQKGIFMKIKSTLNAVGLNIKEEKGKDGNSFYKISIDQDGECGTLSISEDAYKLVEKTFRKYSPVTLTVEYNDQYKNMRVLAVKQG